MVSGKRLGVIVILFVAWLYAVVRMIQDVTVVFRGASPLLLIQAAFFFIVAVGIFIYAMKLRSEG